MRAAIVHQDANQMRWRLFDGSKSAASFRSFQQALSLSSSMRTYSTELVRKPAAGPWVSPAPQIIGWPHPHRPPGVRRFPHPAHGPRPHVLFPKQLSKIICILFSHPTRDFFITVHSPKRSPKSILNHDEVFFSVGSSENVGAFSHLWPVVNSLNRQRSSPHFPPLSFLISFCSPKSHASPGRWWICSA